MAFGRSAHCLGIWIRRSHLGDQLREELRSTAASSALFRATGKPRGHCPDCRSSQLLARKVHGVELDVCPHCQGVWFDQGELGKLQAAMVALTPAAEAAQSRSEGFGWLDAADLGDLLLGLAETAPEVAGKLVLAVFEVILN